MWAMPQSHIEIAVTIRTLAPGRVAQNIYEEKGALRIFHSRDPLLLALPAFRPCQLLLVLLTPFLWGATCSLTPQFSMWKAHMPCLCLAALLPGVSAACACVSARTQYL